MTLPSSTISRSFTGTLRVGDEMVPATILFGDGSVSLVVADDKVGSWPRSEIGLVPTDEGYDIRAEGDSIRFVPDTDGEFRSFITSPGVDASVEPLESMPAPLPPPPAPQPPAPRESKAAMPIEQRRPTAEKEIEGDRANGSPKFDFLDRLAETEPGNLRGGLLEASSNGDIDDEQSGLAFDDAPDEFFAAGLNGPPSDSFPPPFRPVSLDPPPPPARVETAFDPTAATESLEAVDRGLPNGSLPREALETHTPPEPLAETARPSIPREPVVEQEPPSDAVDIASNTRSTETRLSRFIKRATHTKQGEEKETPRQAEPEEDNTPEPITDSENIRQWGLVIAGGLVLLVIVGVVAWGLISLMGGDEPSTEVLETPPSSVATPAPTVQVTTTSQAPFTTVDPENQAAAATFVAAWNGLAAEYAYHMTISADSLPISTAPAPTVHLTYGEDGVLVLTMAPNGTGDDRDILVAMGLAVAWADPNLSPEGRKELLGALGVDVDNPNLAELGGELSRHGVTYDVSLIDAVIRFEVDRSA